MPFTDAKSLITWVINSGGAGVISYYLFAVWNRFAAVKQIPGQWKRVLAIAQAVIIGALLAYVGGLLGLYSSPQGVAGWANLVVSVGVTAGISSQLTHGFAELTPKPSPTPTN